jgi:leucyl aminopeptidase (aminopeptidase T)
VKNGFVTKIEGCECAEKLTEDLKRLGRNAHNVAEFGIGLNEKAIITGTLLEDEKVLGTAHCAVGSNFTFGGTVKAPCHLDGVFKKPSIWADDLQIMDKGKFLIDFDKILSTAVIK